jgi:UDP-glucose 4-epimerase
MNKFRNKKILITGGLGFIGSNLAQKLVSLDAEVTLVDSLIPEYGGNLRNINGFSEKLKINIADIRDQYSMNYLVKGCDYLFNLAGQTSHQDSMENPFTDLEINSKAQLSILEACKKYNPDIKIIFASTRQIYGKPQYFPVDENHPLVPTDINGINKISGEFYHMLYYKVYGIRTCSLRLTNTYGPRMRIKDARQTFVGIWIKNILINEPILIFGDGKQIRDFTYIDDAVDAFLLVALDEKINGKVFNLGGIEKVDLLSLAERLITINGKGEYKTVPFPPNRKNIDIGDYYASFKLFNEATSWYPKINLDSGLKYTFDYFKENFDYYN